LLLLLQEEGRSRRRGVAAGEEQEEGRSRRREGRSRRRREGRSRRRGRRPW